MTFSRSTSDSFTTTEARYVSSKVAADLRQVQIFYGSPNDAWIQAYADELTTLLARRCLDTVEYGFMRNGERVLVLRYVGRLDGTLSIDQNSGRIPPRVDISGAEWFSFLWKNSIYSAMTPWEREQVESLLPFRRTAGYAPTDGAGQWIDDRSYAASGHGVERRIFRSA